MPRKLIDIDVAEISLVDSAANRKKFYIIKRSKEMEELRELLKSFLGEDPEEEFEKAKTPPDAVLKAIKDALKVFIKYKDDLPDDLVKAMNIMSKYSYGYYGYAYPEKKEAEKKVEEEKKADEEKEEEGKTVIEKLNKVIELLNKASEFSGYLKEATEALKSLITKDETPSEPNEVLKQKIQEVEKRLDEIAKKDAQILELQKRIEELEKIKGVKKSLDGQEAGVDEGPKLWPSFFKIGG